MAETKFTAKELADCAQREVAQRRYVYGKRVDAGAMKRETADKQIAMMQAIADRYRAEADAEAQAGRLL